METLKRIFKPLLIGEFICYSFWDGQDSQLKLRTDLDNDNNKEDIILVKANQFGIKMEIHLGKESYRLENDIIGLDKFLELKLGFYCQLAIKDVTINGLPEILLAIGNGFDALYLNIWQFDQKTYLNTPRGNYIKPFKFLGCIEGKDKIFIYPDGKMDVPYGSQGLFETYIWDGLRFISINRSSIMGKNTNTMKIDKHVNKKEYDAFLAHANEDKESIANELYKELTKSGLNIWYDDFCINPGDSIREKIDEGLLNSNHGLLLLSKNFFKKSWCQKELNALFSLNINNIIKKIIPIWFQVTRSEVEKYSPIMADIKAVSIVDKKIIEAIKSITKVIKADTENKKMLEINNSNSEKEINSSKDKTLDIDIKIIKQESYYDRVKKASCDSIGITFLIDNKPGFYLDVYITRTQAAVYEGHTNKDSFEYLIEKGRNILNSKITRNNYKSQVIDLSPIIRKQFNS